MFGRTKKPTLPQRPVLAPEMVATLRADGRVPVGSWSAAEIAAIGLYDETTIVTPDRPSGRAWSAQTDAARSAATAAAWESLVAAGTADSCPPSTPPRSRVVHGTLQLLQQACGGTGFVSYLLAGDPADVPTRTFTRTVVRVDTGDAEQPVALLSMHWDELADRLQVEVTDPPRVAAEMVERFWARPGSEENELVVTLALRVAGKLLGLRIIGRREGMSEAATVAATLNAMPEASPQPATRQSLIASVTMFLEFDGTTPVPF